MKDFSSDNLSLLLAVISIFMSFILTTANYILGSWVPQLRDNTLKERIIRNDIIYDLRALLQKKQTLWKWMNLIYLISMWAVLLPLVLYFFVQPCLSIIFIMLGITVISILFIILVICISKITQLSLEIDKQLLDFEK